MTFLKVLKSRLSRHREKREVLEIYVNDNAASPNQLTDYKVSKALEKETEFLIDVIEGSLKKEE